ncbi:MAG: hypothetical protein JW994_05840 [Candidatus Omnitrophica bacterium]|nr:hypothetical protein [Candidatus Omnitrophota bacterium]
MTVLNPLRRNPRRLPLSLPCLALPKAGRQTGKQANRWQGRGGSIGAGLFLVFYIFILLLSAGTALAYIAINEKGYNSILMEYISGAVAGDKDDFQDKVRLLRDFVHYNVHPVYGEKNRLDTVGIDKLVSGIGWCDQTSRVFMQLAKKQGITTRLLFLLNEKGSSPHTVAEAWDGKRWILVDTIYAIDFYNKKGEPASLSDIREDFDIVTKNPRVKVLGQHNSWWGETENLTMYYRDPVEIVTKEGSKVRVLSYLPLAVKKFFVSALQELYIFKKSKSFTSRDGFLYFKARSYHLVGRTKKAERIYREILEGDATPAIKTKTYFFMALLLKDEKKLNESVEVLSDLITQNGNNWILYAHGLRRRLYENLGEKEKAREDFYKIIGSPDAYF